MNELKTYLTHILLFHIYYLESFGILECIGIYTILFSFNNGFNKIKRIPSYESIISW